MLCVLKRDNFYLSVKMQFRMLNTPNNIDSIEYKTSTINTAEVKTFSDRMKTWWEPEGQMKALHSLNELRVPFIIDSLKKNISYENSNSLENLKLLDVGCGGGILTEALAKQGAKVTGIDASSELIDVAIHHSRNGTSKPTYYCTTIEDHAIKNANLYDGVIASEVIEHVNNQELFIKSCVQTLKPNGRIIFTTPSKTRLSQFLVIWFAENIINNPPKGTHQYELFISAKDLSIILEKYGCQIEQTHGFCLNMMTNKWFWTKNQIFFYALQAIKQ